MSESPKPADALRTLDLPFEDQQVLWYSTEAKESLFLDGVGVKYLEQTLAGYTAVVCYNDEIASRLVAQLSKRGVSIPEDLAVVSFDNSQYSEMTTPRITSLSHGSHNVGRMAAELLMHLFEGKPCQSQLAPWTLVQKESS